MSHGLMPTMPADLLSRFHADGSRALVARWLAHLVEQAHLGQLADSTVATYRRNVAMWLRFLDEIARTDRPTPATVGQFIAATRPNRKPAAVNALLFTVRSLYRWAESCDLCPDIARAVKPLRVARDEPLPALTRDQVVDLVASIDGVGIRGLRDRALICTMFAAAARCVSLERANVGDVDLEAGTLRHQPKGYTAKAALARLTPVAVAALRVFLRVRNEADATAPLFTSVGNRRSADGRLSTRSMREIVLALMERGGHATRDGSGELSQPGAFSAHCLRRSALTAAFEAQGVEAAQVLAGHASADTTKRAYIRVHKDRQLRSLTASLDLPMHVLSVGGH